MGALVDWAPLGTVRIISATCAFSRKICASAINFVRASSQASMDSNRVSELIASWPWRAVATNRIEGVMRGASATNTDFLP